jgi:hypothetical protein
VRRSYHRNDKALVNPSKQAEQQAEPTREILHSTDPTDPTDPTDLPKRNVPTIPNDEGNLQQRQGLRSDGSERSVARSV